ncbi:branched-chain amino acid transport system II carrier protein [Aliarcobacter vitoriensis]|uniref:branched-chain amino acid transport system II carrier protein n=1 Tax=Aliarcobacter vitoriensis TaxID=2011099 RepID=UPI003AB0722F
MLTQSKFFKDALILGFAIFSMYFGAGNIIFPPYLGLTSSSNWDLAFMSYFIADIGFATLTMFALLKAGGRVENLTHKIGTIAGIFLTSAIILCIGPLIALPRTGATTYEMLIVPFFGASFSNSLITSIIYYSLILIFTLKPTTMIEILGRFLTPALFIGLLILIIKGVFFPIADGEIAQSEATTSNIIFDGMLAGYQTLDVLAALAFGIIILKAVSDKGVYTEHNQQIKLVAYASIVAAICIFIIYFGLTYLGATTSTVYESNIDRATLLNNIIFSLFGSGGNLLLGIVVFLACFTTGAALVSVTSEYFSRLSHRRVSYKTLVVVVTIFSIILTNFGLEFIISIAFPILTVVYPAAIILVVLSFFDNFIKNDNVYKLASFAAMIYCVVEVISKNIHEISFLKIIPFYEIGFAWIIPATVFGIIGYFVKPKKED